MKGECRVGRGERGALSQQIKINCMEIYHLNLGPDNNNNNLTQLQNLARKWSLGSNYMYMYVCVCVYAIINHNKTKDSNEPGKCENQPGEKKKATIF